MLGLFTSRRLKALEDTVAKLRRDLDDRDLDWVDMRSRCKRLLDRTEKAARLLRADEDPAAVAAAPNGDPQQHGGRFLTPKQMEIQQAVMKRRGGA